MIFSLRPQTVRAEGEYGRQVLHGVLGVPALFFLAGFWPSWLLPALILLGLIAHHYLVPRFLWLTRFYRKSERPWMDGPSNYAYGVFLSWLILPMPVAMLAWLVLAWGDSLATIVGLRYPIRALYDRRSLGGVVGMVVGSAGAFFTFWLVTGHATIRTPVAVLLPVVLAFAVAAEVFSTRINDNLTIPLAVGLGWILCEGFFSRL